MTTPRRGRRNISDNVRVLHNALTNILNDEDRAYFIRSLNKYQKDRDVIELVDSLKRVLDTPRKRDVYPLLRDIIPSNDKRYFEKTWHTSQGQSLNSSKWSTNSTTRLRSHSRSLEPSRRSNIHSSLPENLDKYDSGIDIPNLKNGTTSRSPQKYPIRRLYIKRAQGTGFGFSMRGGSEHGVGLYVSSVDENSLAEYEGLLPGDHILSVNEIQFDGLSHDQAVKIIKNNKKLSMVVRSVGRIPNTFVAEATYKWIDPGGQRVSPPPIVDSNGREMSTDGIHRSDLRLLGDDDERKVNIFVEDGDKLGLKIRGGSEYGLGIYIAGVDPRSAADKAGLKVGDQIMDVNGASFLNISHANAVKVLKSAKNMMVIMKDVGRLPFAKTTTDRTNWAKGKLPHTTLQSDTESINTVQIHVPPTTFDDRRNTTAGTTRFERRPEDSKFRQGIAGSQLMYNGTGPSTKSLTEEQARQILNENEYCTMSYYLEEYRKGFIVVDALVLALFSLFNTPAKVSLLTEVRGSIVPKDIDRFDDLVLKKEIDAIKSRKIGAHSHEDAQSIRSYSSSMSSYSGHSSSSRSSARGSHSGADSRPITPPRVPEILPSSMRGGVRANQAAKSKISHDKTLTNETENGGLFSSPNESFNDSQDSPLELSSIFPVSSSSPRNPNNSSMTNGEITKYLNVGDNDRNKPSTADKRNSKNAGSPRYDSSSKSLSKEEQAKEEPSATKTLSSELPTETTKKEKRGFSLFPHSNSKGSYSPNKYTDHSTANSEVLPMKSSYDKNFDEKPPSSHNNGTDSVKDLDLGAVNQESRNLDNKNKKHTNKQVVEKQVVEKKTPSSLSVNEKAKSRTDDPTRESSNLEHLHKPKPHHSESRNKEFDSRSGHLEGRQANIDSKRSLSAFAPPKPPRSFHLSEDHGANKSNAQENPRKFKQNEITGNDISKNDTSDQITGDKEEISSVCPPKPKPYQSYAQEQTSKMNIPSHLDLDIQDNDYVDVEGINLIVSPPKAKAPISSSNKSISNSRNTSRTQNEYVDIDINHTALSPPTMAKPLSSKTVEKTEKNVDATPPGSVKSNVTPQENIQVLSFVSLETPKEIKWLESSQQQSLDSERLESVEIKPSVPPAKPPPYSPNKDNRDQCLEGAEKKASTPPTKPPPYSPTREDNRDGMFLAMEATTTNRSGLERSTCWGDESMPFENTSLYSVVNIFPRNTKNTSDTHKTDDHVTRREQEVPKKSPSEDARTSVQSQKSNTYESIRSNKERVDDCNAKKEAETKVIRKEFPKKSPSEDVRTSVQSQKSNTYESIRNDKERVDDCNAKKEAETKVIRKEVPKKSPSEDVRTSVHSQKSNTYESIRNDKERVDDSDAKKEAETKVIRNVSPKVITHDENQNITEELPPGSLVRSMIKNYNHMSDESRPRDKLDTTSQKSSNRKSWDGVHTPAVPDESRKIPSLENKRRIKSNSDSNLMNLPKDQQKDIQVKLRASQELFDLRQQTKSRESSANNSPRHSIDMSQHSTHQPNPTSDADHLVRSQHGVGYEVQIQKTSKGLGLTLEGGSDHDTSSSNAPIKIKNVKEGPYAAHLSGKLRPGQELVQINTTPVKGMTNAMAVLTLRQTYADPETTSVSLVVKDP